MSSNFDPVKLQQLSRGIYVILLKDTQGRLTLLADPGMSRPWSSKNKRLADFHAKECDGEARTWEDAFNLLVKEHPTFEKELVERIAKKAQDFTKTVLDKNSLKHGINTNANRSTDFTNN